MNNLFPPGVAIPFKYDMKGSVHSRMEHNAQPGTLLFSLRASMSVVILFLAPVVTCALVVLLILRHLLTAYVFVFTSYDMVLPGDVMKDLNFTQDPNNKIRLGATQRKGTHRSGRLSRFL